MYCFRWHITVYRHWNSCQRSFRIALSWTGMPHLDGIGVLEKISMEYGEERPKVIILTAFGQEARRRRAVELGANYYILKPFVMEILANKVRELAVIRWGKSGIIFPEPAIWM